VLTYSQVLEKVTHLASILREEGIQPGDRVLLRLFNRPHFILTWFAVLRIGGVVVATAPPLKSRELNTVIESANPKVVISEPELWDELEKTNLHSARLVDITQLQNRRSQTAASVGAGCVAMERDALAIVAYTSGSTGTPKGCMHSHADLLAVCDTYAR